LISTTPFCALLNLKRQTQALRLTVKLFLLTYLLMRCCVWQRRHSYRSSSKRSSQNVSPKPTTNPDSRLSSGEGHRRLSRSRNMTMPARRRTSSSGRSPRPPSDYRDPPPQQQPEFDASETDPNGVAAAADIAVYRVRNFTTKSGSVINRGDSIKVRRGHTTAAAAGLRRPRQRLCFQTVKTTADRPRRTT